MKIIRTFATSANLGPGFDTLGVCFDIYNEYGFEASTTYILEGFDSKYSLPSNNLIIKCYEEVFNHLNKDVKPIKLVQMIQNIPTSRGLGSSASCIVAGVMIANNILNNILTMDEVFQIASRLEGHPDNVAPLIFGGLTSSFKNEIYKTVKLNVNHCFKWTVCIPSFELETSVARGVLPKVVNISDAVSNISHSIALIKALETGDIDLLKAAAIDKLHENYRFPLIEGSSWFIEFAKENDATCMISGAGPTILLISKDKLNLKYIDWDIKEVNVNNQGAYIYEK